MQSDYNIYRPLYLKYLFHNRHNLFLSFPWPLPQAPGQFSQAMLLPSAPQTCLPLDAYQMSLDFPSFSHDLATPIPSHLFLLLILPAVTWASHLHLITSLHTLYHFLVPFQFVMMLYASCLESLFPHALPAFWPVACSCRPLMLGKQCMVLEMSLFSNSCCTSKFMQKSR